MKRFAQSRRHASSRSRNLANLTYETLEPKNLLAAVPVISEFMASNLGTLEDGYGNSEDWIELTNRGDQLLNLSGFHLTDDALNPTKWTFESQTFLPPGEFLVVFASSRDEVDPAGNLHTNFKLSAGGEYVALAAPGGTVLSEFGTATENYPAQFADLSFGDAGGSLVNRDSLAHYLVPTAGDSSLGTAWTANGFDAIAAGFTTGVAAIGYENSPGSQVNYSGLFQQPAIPSGTTSTYLRTEFELADKDAINDLTLRLNFDDGFAAYLNGTFLFSRNAENGLAWNASASRSHDDSDAIGGQSFALDGSAGAEGNFLDLLVDGTNTLAIHALNVINSSDMLLVPTLTSTSIFSEGRYLSTPTPSSENSDAVDLGPLIEDVTPSGTPAFRDQAFVVTAKVSDFGRPVDPSSVRLLVRRGFGTESSLVMNDQGLGNDAVAGDGTYTASIAMNGASVEGQLTRWAVTAADIDGVVSRAPRFFDPLNSAEYFGTVVHDPAIDTDLPLLQWFVANPAAASTDAGTRGSLFFNGEYYDNIQTDSHGQSTRLPEFVKKSFDFDANSGDKFLIADGYRASDFNLLTNYADQTKLRHSLGYDAFGQAGLATHLAFSVTVYQNGEFYGLFDLVEEGDEEFLERNGLDPNGALYKVNNPLNSAFTEVEKKSREYDTDRSDFQAVVNARGLAGTAAETWYFDNLDVADTINYLVVQNLIASIDFGHKNMYWYNDTEGTGLWSILPWDQDLSYGHTWNANVTPPYFDNTLRQNQTLTQGLNILFQRIYANSTLREMYNRRMRTLSDQLLGEPGTPVSSSYLAQKINELEATIADEAVADQLEWGLQANFAAAYPFNVDQAIDQVRDTWILSQRNHVDNQSNIPSAQSGAPMITFDDNDFDASPISGLQSEEYVRLRNDNGIAIDISGWELTGGIRHAFKGGTVIPAGGSLYVVADVVAFQARTTGPRGGQRLFIQGNYDGQLASSGETVNLVTEAGVAIDTLTTPNEGPTDNQLFLRVTELNYHPNDPGGAAEFIEVANISSGPASTTLDLSGVAISEGPSTPFLFANGTSLASGERLVVVKDTIAFRDAYPEVNVSLIAGEFTGGLGNGGESIRLDDAGGEKILEFTYNDAAPWALAADGAGASLQLVDEAATPTDLLDKHYSWRASDRIGGTPGAAPAVANLNVVISEILANTDGTQVDFIELFNPTDSAINVGGWWLSDSGSQRQKYQIPANTVIAAGEYLVFGEADFNPTPLSPSVNDFGLSSSGDEVWLTNSVAGLGTFIIDVVQFGATLDGQSLARVPAVAGRLSPVVAPTPGAANRAVALGPLIITEVQYHPDDPTAADLAIDSSLTSDDLEFVEIYNASAVATSLIDWRLRGEVDFDFPAASLAAGATALVLRFDPTLVANGAKVAAFQNHYSISPAVTLVGGYAGTLSNSFGRVQIQQPGVAPIDDPADVPHVMTDEVLYDDLAPWPDADGNGNSIQRIAGNASGNLAASWIASQPTPGTVAFIANAPAVAALTRDNGEISRPDLAQTLTFVFDTDVEISSGALQLLNLTTGGDAIDLTDAILNYDSSSFEATWDLSNLETPIPAAFYSVVLRADEVSGAGTGLSLGENYRDSLYVALPGDANLDGQLDVLNDAAALVNNLGLNSNATWALGDFNADGVVDVLNDAAALVNNLGVSVVPLSLGAVARATVAAMPLQSSMTDVVLSEETESLGVNLGSAGSSLVRVAAEVPSLEGAADATQPIQDSLDRSVVSSDESTDVEQVDRFAENYDWMDFVVA